MIDLITGLDNRGINVTNERALATKVNQTVTAINALPVNLHTAVAINTTAVGTLAVVTSGVIAGLITSTSAAAVTVTLDSVANIIAAYTAAKLTPPATGSWIDFAIDNSAGSNTVTLAVDSGATIAVVTPAITGGATLTVSTANKVGFFRLYLTSATAGKLYRIA